jgi:hypothetical protein
VKSGRQDQRMKKPPVPERRRCGPIAQKDRMGRLASGDNGTRANLPHAGCLMRAAARLICGAHGLVWSARSASGAYTAGLVSRAQTHRRTVTTFAAVLRNGLRSGSRRVPAKQDRGVGIARLGRPVPLPCPIFATPLVVTSRCNSRPDTDPNTDPNTGPDTYPETGQELRFARKVRKIGPPETKPPKTAVSLKHF